MLIINIPDYEKVLGYKMPFLQICQSKRLSSQLLNALLSVMIECQKCSVSFFHALKGKEEEVSNNVA